MLSDSLSSEYCKSSSYLWYVNPELWCTMLMNLMTKKVHNAYEVHGALHSSIATEMHSERPQVCSGFIPNEHENKARLSNLEMKQCWLGIYV